MRMRSNIIILIIISSEFHFEFTTAGHIVAENSIQFFFFFLCYKAALEKSVSETRTNKQEATV